MAPVPNGYPNPTRYPVFLSIPDPTQFSFENHRVAGNPKYRVLPDISDISRYFVQYPTRPDPILKKPYPLGTGHREWNFDSKLLQAYERWVVFSLPLTFLVLTAVGFKFHHFPFDDVRRILWHTWTTCFFYFWLFCFGCSAHHLHHLQSNCQV